MDLKDFQNELLTKGAYQTAGDRHQARPDRLFGRMDLWFYLKLARAIYICHKGYISNEFTPKTWPAYSHRIHSIVEDCGGIVNISGVENLKKSKPPFIYISNHMSLVETMLLPVIMLTASSDIAIVLKEDLFKYPYFSSILKAIKPIAVTRKNPKKDFKCVMEKGAEAVQQGRSVLVFPQATRSTDINPEDFNTLGIKLAQKTGVPVVPVALKTDFLKPGKIIRDIGPLDRSKIIHFKFGTPVSVTKENGKQIHAGIIEFISSSLKTWRASETGV